MNTCVTATFKMPEIDKLAEERAKATGESFMNWYDALGRGMVLAMDAMIDPDAFLMVTNSSSKPSQFVLVMEALNGYAKENPYGTNAFNLVAYHIDKSSYTLKDWLEVIDYFYNWLSKNCRQASLSTVLGYVLGCVENKVEVEFKDHDLDFVDIVEKVLGTYGFQD